jgi:flagellar motor switch protein FliN
MSTITPGTPLNSFVEVFRKTLSDVLSQDLASPWKVAIQAEGAPPSGGTTTLCFGISLSGGLRGNAAFHIENAEALLLAQKLLAESPDPAAKLTVARKQAVEQLLRKVTVLAAGALKEQFGEVDLQLTSIEVPNWTGTRVALLAEEASTGKVCVELRLDKELQAGVLPSQNATPGAPVSAGTSAARATGSGENNLDLLLGVELNLTLRFGQRTLTLREILDLSSGSIIELDRQVQEPADLLLGDRLIARGEVVVVDGNYGLRIKEMCDAPTAADKVGISTAR